jgi:hypothetical protein
VKFDIIGQILGALVSLLLALRIENKMIYRYSAFLFSFVNLVNSLGIKSNPIFFEVWGLNVGLSTGCVSILPFYLIWRFYEPKNRPVIVGCFMMLFFVVDFNLMIVLFSDTFIGQNYNYPAKITM